MKIRFWQINRRPAAVVGPRGFVSAFEKIPAHYMPFFYLQKGKTGA